MIDALSIPVVPPTPPITTVLGLCVGDLQTAPSLVVARYHTVLLTPGDPLFGEEPVFETRYAVRVSEQLPPTVSFPAIAARLNTIARRLYDRDDRGDYHLLVDTAEVGRPAVDAIRRTIIPQVHVTSVRVTGDDKGDLSLLWRNDGTIGLRYLLSRLQALLQGNRLTIPDALTDLATGLRTLDAASDRPHPLVRALALAVASEFLAVNYGASPDDLPSAAL